MRTFKWKRLFLVILVGFLFYILPITAAGEPVPEPQFSGDTLVFYPDIKPGEIRYFYIYFNEDDTGDIPEPAYPTNLRYTYDASGKKHLLTNGLLSIEIPEETNAGISYMNVKGMSTENVASPWIARAFVAAWKRQWSVESTISINYKFSPVKILQKGPLAIVLLSEILLEPIGVRWERTYFFFNKGNYCLLRDAYLPPSSLEESISMYEKMNTRVLLGNVEDMLTAYEHFPKQMYKDIPNSADIKEEWGNAGSWLCRYNPKIQEYFGIAFKQKAAARTICTWSTYNENQIKVINFNNFIQRDKPTIRDRWFIAGKGGYEDVKNFAQKINEPLAYIVEKVEQKGERKDWWDNDTKDNYIWNYRVKIMLKNYLDVDYREPFFIGIKDIFGNRKVNLKSLRLVVPEVKDDETVGKEIPFQIFR